MHRVTEATGRYLYGKPTPGSDAAIEQGCKCPVAGNNHGKGFDSHKDSAFFYIVEGCPLHGVDYE